MSETTADREVRWEVHPNEIGQRAMQDGETVESLGRARMETARDCYIRGLRARIGDSDPLTPEEALAQMALAHCRALAFSMTDPEEYQEASLRFRESHRILRDLLSGSET